MIGRRPWVLVAVAGHEGKMIETNRWTSRRLITRLQGHDEPIAFTVGLRLPP